MNESLKLTFILRKVTSDFNKATSDFFGKYFIKIIANLSFDKNNKIFFRVVRKIIRFNLQFYDDEDITMACILCIEFRR